MLDACRSRWTLVVGEGAGLNTRPLLVGVRLASPRDEARESACQVESRDRWVMLPRGLFYEDGTSRTADIVRSCMQAVSRDPRRSYTAALDTGMHGYGAPCDDRSVWTARTST